jgi:hypothetical protein
MPPDYYSSSDENEEPQTFLSSPKKISTWNEHDYLEISHFRISKVGKLDSPKTAQKQPKII